MEVLLLKAKVQSLEKLLLVKEHAVPVQTTFSMQNVDHNDEAVKFYTGLPNYDLILAVFGYLQSKVSEPFGRAPKNGTRRWMFMTQAAECLIP